MLLLVGLGNPGEKYARHRHNVGFMAADAIAERHEFSPPKERFQGLAQEGFLTGHGLREKALILKPQTFMNESGRSVGAAARFYKIDLDNVIVFYDELDLAPGKMRVKVGGGAAGHNGIRSIDAHLGNAFRRIRIGIGHPGDKSKVTGHVLGNFSKDDQDWLSDLLGAIAEAAPLLARDDNRFQTAVAHNVNSPSKPTAQKPTAPPKNNTTVVEKTESALAAAFKKVLGRKEDQ